MTKGNYVTYVRILLETDEEGNWPINYDEIVAMLNKEPAVVKWETLGIKKESF